MLGAGLTYKPRRRIGPQERAVRNELRGLPAEVAKGSVAQSMLILAASADTEELSARDLAQIMRELRQCSQYLREISPPAGTGDEIDELRARREQRLTDTG
jgi:hypothetical protein